jgi:hypothetical protein
MPARPPRSPMNRKQEHAVGGGLFLAGLFVLSQFLAVWAPMVHATETGADQRITLLFGTVHFTAAAEVAIVLGVMLAAMLGSLAYEVRGFTTHALQGDLTERAMPWYLLLPIQGAALATIVYLLLQAGLFGTDPQSLNAYGVAGIAGLVGLFARHALQLLSTVLNKVFGEPSDKNVIPHG